jgi:hypothetical protein
MARRNIIRFCCLSLSVTLAACDPSVQGNGQQATEVRPLGGFSAVDSESSFDVRVEQGDTFSVAVHIDSNLLPLVRTWVSGGTLHLDSYHHLEPIVPGPHVTVRMPALTQATLAGSGRMSVLGVQGAAPLAIRLSGSGNVDFDGSAPSVVASLDGSGDVNLAGKTGNVRLDLSGSGSIDAANLLATSGTVDLAGSGNIRATIHGPASAVLRGSGDIDLYGEVVLERASKSGSGDIRVH